MIREVEAIVIGNILNDRNHLKNFAVLPRYFFDRSFADIVEYVTSHDEYNLYDMCQELDINFELATDLSTCIADKATFQNRMLVLIDQSNRRDALYNEIRQARDAMGELDPLSVAEILHHNLGRILEQGRIPEVSN